jgi:hypothetical protein
MERYLTDGMELLRNYQFGVRLNKAEYEQFVFLVRKSGRKPPEVIRDLIREAAVERGFEAQREDAGRPTGVA